ncbi:MAG: NADH-quinone oxidoreductase subunit NuoK [Bacillota bacterium]|jgi:NADH:ubiquinone oxidoreductase subunit K
MINSAELIAAVAILVLGLLCIIINRNMIKTFIGIEILNRAITLILVSSGFYRGEAALAQAVAVLSITIDAVVVAVALSLIINAKRLYGDVNSKLLTRLKG